MGSAVRKLCQPLVRQQSVQGFASGAWPYGHQTDGQTG